MALETTASRYWRQFSQHGSVLVRGTSGPPEQPLTSTRYLTSFLGAFEVPSDVVLLHRDAVVALGFVVVDDALDCDSLDLLP